MKRSPLYSLRRFFSILILDKDIIEEKPAAASPHHTIHPLFLQEPEIEVSEKDWEDTDTISIQPQEIWEKEDVTTLVFPEISSDEMQTVDPVEDISPMMSPVDETYIPFWEEDVPFEGIDTKPVEDIPYDYPIEEAPLPPEKPARQSHHFSSLKDVLRERGNFWEEKQQKTVGNIWHRETELPEDMITLTDDMVVWDVLPEAIENIAKKQKESSVQDTEMNRTEEKEWAMILGISNDNEHTIALEQSSLARHTLIVGQTGSGKSTLMERMILQDIESGRWVGVIDPHGDLYESILKQIPKSRSNDVVLFDLADIDYPIGFNILENTHEQFPSLVASSIVGVFKKIFGYSWWPRLEYILRNATLTLLEKPGSTLLDLTMLLTDEDFREKYLKHIKNPFLDKFWSIEFGALSQARQAEIVSPILNKVGQFLSIPLIRNIVSQPQSGFSPRWVMDNKKIFLANLSKGKIGEDVSDMFGSMLVSKFQLDVMSRATIEPEKRVPFRLYVDEFQNFATESFSDIFSEARKYAMELIIAHQYLGQVDKKLTEAILGNVGNIISFHTSSEDARILAPNMSSQLDTSLLTEQQHFSFVLKTVKDGKKVIETGELISPALIASPTGVQNPEKLRTLVREKFAKKREFVEGKLADKIEQ